MKIKRSELVSILENDYEFRDYRVLPKRLFKKVNKVGVHTLLTGDDLYDPSWDIESAINTFVRDGFPTIYFYI